MGEQIDVDIRYDFIADDWFVLLDGNDQTALFTGKSVSAGDKIPQ